MDYIKYLEEMRKMLVSLVNERKVGDGYREKEIQAFFEQHPSALLGVITGIPSNENIFNNVIISQPRIKSMDGDRQPDFLIVTYNSSQIYFNFIELEDPSKKIYQIGVRQTPTAEFQHSINQLKQWGSFLNNEIERYCVSIIESLFKDSYDNALGKYRFYNYILLYGFSDEIRQLSSEHNSLLEEYFKDKNYHHCTYSRLIDSFRPARYPLFSVKKNSTTNRFKAIGFTPFTNYTTELWYSFHNIEEKQEIVSTCNWLTAEEKSKLSDQMTILDSKPLSNFKTGLITIKNWGDIELSW